MKNIYITLVLLIFRINGYSQSTNSIHNFDAITITGDTINLSQYAGKKLMIVNTASFADTHHNLQI